MPLKPASTQCLLDSSHTFAKEGVNRNVDGGDAIKIDATHERGARDGQNERFPSQNPAILRNVPAFCRLTLSHESVVLA